MNGAPQTVPRCGPGHEWHSQRCRSQAGEPDPEPEPANTAEVQEEAAPAVTREWLTRQLLELVSARTGYPKDMLRMDLDLEGELGIDSIKRVEILGSLAESLGTDDDMDSPIELEQLTTLRTLGGIIDYLEEALAETDAPADEEPLARRDRQEQRDFSARKKKPRQAMMG